MREASTKLIYEYAKKDKRVMALTSDGRNGVYERIKEEMPCQYMDYGIAEQNMVASAAGLASCGKIPFIFGTSTFLAMRAFEFIRNDVCIPNMNVKFIGIFSGLSRPSWGATHQGTEELALLRCLPNIMIITPSTPIQAREATRYAYEHNGPVYIRLEASGESEFYTDDYVFTPGKAETLFNNHEGREIAIITCGTLVDVAIDVALEVEKRGISMEVLDMPTVKPIDRNAIIRILDSKEAILTFEEHSLYGGLGSAVAEVIAESGKAMRFCRIGLDGCAVGCGSREFVRKINGLTKTEVIKALETLLKL